MPQAIAVAVLPLLNTTALVGAIGASGVILAATAVGYGVTALGLYAATALVSEGFRPASPSVPKPEDGKFNLRQNVPYLPFVLGRVKKAGDYILLEERSGNAHHIIVHAAHRIQGYVTHYLHETALALDGSGYVTSPAHFTLNGTRRVRVLTRLGLNASSAYSEVVSALPTIWTTAHRGDGLASIYMLARGVPIEDFSKVYPQNMPSHTAVIDGALLYDPRTETTGFSTNLALEKLWWLTHPVGGKLTLDDIYLPDFEHAADVCDEFVTNRQGNSVRRYHGGMWFRANSDQVAVGRTLREAGDMILYERPDGKIGIHAGEYVAPTIRLDERSIISHSFDANRRKTAQVVAIRGRFTNPAKGYNTDDAAIYGNPYDTEDERTKTVDNVAVQDHNHMARLQKLKYIRQRAPIVGITAHYQDAKGIRQSRFVRVHLPPRMNESVVEIIDRPQISLRSLTVTFKGIIVPSSLYAFNAATEEGVPGGDIVEIVPDDIPVPQNFDVTIESETVAGGDAFYGLGTWDALDEIFTVEMEWQRTSGGATSSVTSIAGENEVQSNFLADGLEYRFRARVWSGGTPGEWTGYITRTAV